MQKKLILWSVYTVLISIAPLVVSFLIRLTRGESTALSDIIGNGELLLITVAILGAAIGELLAGNHRYPEFELISGGICILTLLISSLYFADISGANAVESRINTFIVEKISYWLFGSGLISGAISIILSEL